MQRRLCSGFAGRALLCVVLCCGMPAGVLAQGEHSRRAAAELRVLAGDFRRLAEEAPAETEVAGLAERINGSLAMISLLMRLADNEQRRPPANYRKPVFDVRQHWQERNIPGAVVRLQSLLDQFPLGLTVTDLPFTSIQYQQASQLHQSLCAACHDHPVVGLSRPAYNLFAEAKTLPSEEFAARMLVGVKGDRVTGIDNPLSDLQLANMIRFYRSHSPD